MDAIDKGTAAPTDVAAKAGRAKAGWRYLLLRLRLELAGALLLCIVLPALYRNEWQFNSIFSPTESRLSVGILFAVLCGYFFHRRVTNFPGINAPAYILPSFAASFSIVITAFFFARIDYSRLAFLISFVFAIGWVFAYDLARRALDPTHLGIVPVGNVGSLGDIGGVIWHPIASPSVTAGSWDGIVADLRADLSDDWERFIAATALSGKPVYHVKQIRESLTGRVEIEHLSENTLGSLNPNQAYLKIKQIGDWLVAALALLLLSPLLAIVAVAIRLDSTGPAFFVQQRLGYRGKVIRVIKFRTMRHEAGPSESFANRAAAMTRAGDERVTDVGRFLRRTRIDELPQILNILRGEMSWIGPRPEALVLSTWYNDQVPFYSYRHIVRPGITGWAQVNQGHVAEIEDIYYKLNYDFYYIKNFSAWLDVLILIRTGYTILSGFGSK